MVRNKVQISKGFNIGPSEIERLPFWEYELMMEEMVNIAEEEKNSMDAENDSYKSITDKYNPKNFKAPEFKMPKMPSMPKI